MGLIFEDLKLRKEEEEFYGGQTATYRGLLA
jgi:hypothetical protein